jgi:hypothetical protein
VFEVNYTTLADKARSHDISAEDIADWVRADPNFPEKFLATHGKVAWAAYLKIKEYADSRQLAGTLFAHRHAATAESLREAARLINGIESDNATRFRPTLT